jgi:membrane protease subunit HflK
MGAAARPARHFETERNFMPWNNQSGGGGGPWGGGGNGGPWGQGPRGPGGPQGSPPDLEDIIRRGQDRLKRALPGGGGMNPAVLGLIGVALVAFWLFQSIYTVQPDELAVELRFGKPKEELSEPGLHFHWWPIETVEKANTAEKLINIGEVRGSSSSGLMLSGDQNIVDVKFSVAYQVSDPNAYLFNVADPDEMVRQIAESAMREAVGRRPAQDIFRDDRQGIADAVRGIIQQTLDSYGAGLNVNAISIEDAAPPREVADAFDEVQRAEQDEDRFVEESNQYSNQRLGQARGEAAQIREEAAAYKNRIVQEAEGEAQRFVSVYDEYAKAPDVTRKRLFLETMEQVLKGSNKVIVDEKDGQGVVPYLPLPELQKRAAPAEENK